MLRRLRQLIVAVLFGVLGAAAGRAFVDLRKQQEAGEQPTAPSMSLDRISVRPQDVVPGIMAAMRVTNRPWSWLHIPPWIAAFVVNFGLVAFARELGSLRGMSMGSIPGMGDAESDPPWDDGPADDAPASSLAEEAEGAPGSAL
ncbi:MAG TPA: hypothetical protein QGI71_02205 [Dehalococcoidia bacterium]|jgi:hypothetical protein|nr:hypothetical protein [Dehalococcoidia bacterium]